MANYHLIINKKDTVKEVSKNLLKTFDMGGFSSEKIQDILYYSQIENQK